MERFADLRGSPGKVDDQTILINTVDRKTVRLQPALNGFSILRGESVALTQLLRSKPAVELGCILMMHCIDQLHEARFGFRRALEYDQQMIEDQVVSDGTTIVFYAECCCGCVPSECYELRFVD